jgi:hypothetical protein
VIGIKETCSASMPAVPLTCLLRAFCTVWPNERAFLRTGLRQMYRNTSPLAHYGQQATKLCGMLLLPEPMIQYILPEMRRCGQLLAHHFLLAVCSALLAAFAAAVVLFQMSQPHPRRILTTFGVTAAVRGTRRKMKDLWIAYANASCVARPE